MHDGFHLSLKRHNSPVSFIYRVVRDLIEEQAKIFVYDPEVTRDEMWNEMNYTCGVNHDNTPHLDAAVTTATDPYEACNGAHALCILTEWDMFKELDYEKIFAGMAKPAFLFDGRNILDHAKLRTIGFEVHAIGKLDKAGR